MKRSAPATDRNRAPLLEVLREVLPPRGLVVEIASGTGQHAVYFGSELPSLTWQPSDTDPEALASIRAWVGEAELANVKPPLELDVTCEPWPVTSAEAVVCINMIHIAPWVACEGLFRGAERILLRGAPLCLYGPYRFDGAFTAPSNASFDASLRARDPSWGVRDVADVTRLAERHGFARAAIFPMPANNHSLLFLRT